MCKCEVTYIHGQQYKIIPDLKCTYSIRVHGLVWFRMTKHAERKNSNSNTCSMLLGQKKNRDTFFIKRVCLCVWWTDSQISLQAEVYSAALALGQATVALAGVSGV